MEFMRKCCRKEETGLEEKVIIEYIQGKRLIWNDHVGRVNPNRCIKKVIEWSSIDRRKTGRPRK